MRNLFGILSAVLLIGCGEVTTAALETDAGDGGAAATAGSSGAGGAGGDVGQAGDTGAAGASAGTGGGAPGGSGGSSAGRGGTGGAGGGCQTGQTKCGTTCVDTRSNYNHCGACNIVCATGQACVNSACTATTTGTGGRGGAGGSAPAFYCPGGTDVTCITEQGVGTCTAMCVLGQNQRGTQPNGTACFCFFHAPGTGNYTDCPPDSYCGPN